LHVSSDILCLHDSQYSEFCSSLIFTDFFYQILQIETKSTQCVISDGIHTVIIF